MTNKPMLSVEREFKREDRYIVVKRSDLDRIPNRKVVHAFLAALAEVSAHSVRIPQREFLVIESDWPEFDPAYQMIEARMTGQPATQHQGDPVAQSEFEPDAICLESDGCPTEGAVLKRFWRENQPDPVLCEFYEAEDFPSLVRELVRHIAQLQEAAKRNVKPWEDTFPPTLLPAYIARINAEQPAPVADHTQCEECKGWGYHENHHEGGGTECGECGGSGNATVAVVKPDVDELAQIIRKVDGSHTLGAGSLAEAILEELTKLS